MTNQENKTTIDPITGIESAPSSPSVIRSIKGLNADWTCRGFKFEVGKTYSVEGPIVACRNGFHACPIDQHPLSVFEFYAPAGSRFVEVTQSGKAHAQETKFASATITIGIELSISDLVARAVKWVWERATLVEGSQATGYLGAASATGEHSVAVSIGLNARALATETNALCLINRDPDTGAIRHIRASKAGENGIEAGVWYVLNEFGEFKKAEDMS